MPNQDKFGFQFWLLWIVSFAGSFLISAVFWTWSISSLLGSLSQPELLITWALSVFGCWFLILTPFMRKKERIWKRLNQDQEKATDAWLKAMGSFIFLLIVVCFFWGWQLRAQIAETPGFSKLWARNVFSSWLVLVLPFLVYLYKKADAIYKAAVERQTQWGPKFQSVFVDKVKRQLPPDLAGKIKDFPETLHDGHVVNLVLKDGRMVPDVFVFRGEEVLGIYNVASPNFEIQDVRDVELVKNLPAYDESKWLRLDGRA